MKYNIYIYTVTYLCIERERGKKKREKYTHITHIKIPVVPHKAVAEVSKIGNL